MRVMSSILRWSMVVGAWAAMQARAEARELLPECQPQQAVKQASLYAETKNWAAARGELEMVLQTERGAGDMSVWLALALITLEQGDVETTGAAMAQVYRLNESQTNGEALPEWGQRFIERYENSLGQLVIEDKKVRQVALPVQYERGGFEQEANAVLEREQHLLVRTTMTPIHLPPGVYRVGKARVEIRAGSDSPGVILVDSLGDAGMLEDRAGSAPKPAPFEVVPSPYAERCKERALPLGVSAAGTAPQGKDFFETPWPWIIGGLAIAGAGAAAAAVALHEPDYRFRFDGAP